MALQQHLESITKILETVGERVEGNLYCDIEARHITADINKINNLRITAVGKQKICEIGVNACHSLLLMLDVNPTAEYALFDIGIHKYLEPCFQYLETQFSSTTMKLYLGDSKLTLPAYAENHEGEFDMCHVDGGHEPPEFTSDYKNSLALLKKGGFMVFDDYDYTEIKKFIDEKIGLGEVQRVDQSPLLSIPNQIVLMKV